MKRILALTLVLAMAVTMTSSFAFGVSAAEVGELEIGTGKVNAGVISNTYYPNSTIKYIISAEAAGFSSADLAKIVFEDKQGKFSISYDEGSDLVKSYEFKKVLINTATATPATTATNESAVQLEMKLKETYGTKTNQHLFFDIKFQFTRSRVHNGVNYKSGDFFKVTSENYVGWDKLPGSDSIEVIANDTEVILDDADMKAFNGEIININFGDDAYLDVRMSSQPDLNLYYSTAVIKEIATKIDNFEVGFIDFRGRPVFDYTATVTIPVNTDDYGNAPWLYYYDGANLIPVAEAGDPTYWDRDDESFTFKTKSLSTLVIAEREIPFASTLGTTAPTTTNPAETGEGGVGGTTTGNVAIPDTGSSDYTGIAVVMALISIATAGAVSIKKTGKR